MEIKTIAHLNFRVADLERTERFYCGLLGMKRAFDFKDQNGKLFGFYLSAGGRTFVEFFVSANPIESPNDNVSYSHLSLEVDDIDAFCDQLRQNGIEFSEKMLGADNSWQSWIRDPDGNRIELHQYTAESFQSRAIAGEECEAVVINR